MTEKEKSDVFFKNYEKLEDKNKDKLLLVGKKLLEIKKLVIDTKDKKENQYGICT